MVVRFPTVTLHSNALSFPYLDLPSFSGSKGVYCHVAQDILEVGLKWHVTGREDAMALILAVVEYMGPI